MSKWCDRRDEFVNCIRHPFKVHKELSVKSQSISDRENDPEVFLKRITPQIIETYQKGLKYSTPEEWDESFMVLGGGQSRRKSSAILERFTWDQFLYNFYEIISH